MALVAISVCALSSFVYAQRNDDVLRRPGTFVLETSIRLTGVIADESYQQKLYAPPFSSGTRRLIRQHGMRAEALFVGLPAAQEWMFVRNVVTVDRQPDVFTAISHRAVSDSGDRLDRLFKDGGGDRAAYRRFDASVRVLAPDEQR